MNIRIRGAIDGIARYFQKGKKGKPRDEWDTRIAVHGDLDVFQTDIDIINTQHNWTQAYKHITFGISPTDEEWFSKLSDEDKAKKIDELTRDWLKLYVPQYKDDIDKLNWYSEIHIPKKIYDENGNRRWPHAHLALSLLDPFRGKRLRVVSFSEEEILLDKLTLQINMDLFYQKSSLGTKIEINLLKAEKAISTKT
ncbi:hypothetical protein NI374_23835 (plasmid) [Vibrio parahaemolyticus]|nr:hypothetical protein NI374_23835 [Vibrio parahaemolyticus]